MNFNSFKLKELASIQTGPFGSQLHKEDYCEIGTPIVTVEHLGQKNFRSQNLPKVSDYDTERLKKYLLKTGDIVFSRVGSVDRCSYVSPEFDKWLFSGRCLRVRVANETLNPEYLYYYFCQNSIKEYVRSVAVGATMPSINTKIMGELPIRLPSRKNQDQIVNILSSFDDKINLNNKIILNLNNQIRAIAQEYLYDKSQSSDKIYLNEVCDFHTGYSYKGSELHDENANYGLVTIKNFIRGGGFSSEGYKPITPSKKVKENQFIDLFDIIVAHTDLTQKAEILGNAEIVLDTAGFQHIVASMDLVKVVPRADCHIPKFMIAAALKSNNFKSHCLQYANGTTVLHLSKKALTTYSFYVPKDKKLLFGIANIIEAHINQTSSLIRQNNTLLKLRDSLLPKLMSDEISFIN